VAGFDRFLLSEAELRLRAGGKWHRYEPDVLPAFVAEMDFRVAPPIQGVLERMVETQDYGYGSMEDGRRLADAFGRRMRARYNWDADPDLVVPTADVIQGIATGIVAFSEPGDGVVVQTPVYPPFLRSVPEVGRRLVENPLIEAEDGFHIDFARLRAVIDERTRVILFCNPHNPTGRAFKRGELRELLAIAAERDLVVVSDEIHSDLTFPGATHTPFAALAGGAERTVTLTSATKAFNIPGARCAVMHFGDQRLLEHFRERFPDFAIGHPSRFGLEATITAWDEGQAWLDLALEYLEANRARITEWTRSLAPELALGYHPPEATYLAWFDCSRQRLPAESPHQFFLDQARVGLGVGADFGPPGAECVRLNFATSAAILDRILERMAEAMAAVRAGRR
jgi:cystathionine beta-lyase